MKIDCDTWVSVRGNETACKRAKMNGTESYAYGMRTLLVAIELNCTFTVQFESEVVIIAYCSWNCIAFVTTLHLNCTGPSSTINNILCCVHFCMDDYCSSRNAVKRNLCKENYKSLILLQHEKIYDMQWRYVHANRSPIFIFITGERDEIPDHNWCHIVFRCFFLLNFKYQTLKLWADGHWAKGRQLVRFQWI